MPDTIPITEPIHLLFPAWQSPPCRSCQEKPPFPPLPRVAMAIPASASPPNALHLRWTTASITERDGAGAASERRRRERGLRRAPRERRTARHRHDADSTSVPLVKKGKESGEPEIPTNPPAAPRARWEPDLPPEEKRSG